MVTLYGIPNCDTVKKARAWLAGRGAEYVFHDFKKQGVPAEIAQWSDVVGWERLLNRKGNTWRTLSAAQQATATDAQAAIALMREHASVIKRPVVDWGDGAPTRFTVGFDVKQWEILSSGSDAER
jgi:arsenate reductase (glutaredoxin)